ncbi:MAG: hydroxymethylglutaryl-CoA lyase [Acidimicrobiales bacterium]
MAEVRTGVTGLPQRFAVAGIPEDVHIYEVGPRDGLQAEQAQVPARVKVELIQRLAAAGLHTIEATSFVSPRWVPQLGDAEEVVAMLDMDGSVRYPVLVPNLKGLDRAMDAGVREIAVFASATESFAGNNLNTTVDGALRMFEPVISRARGHGMPVRGYISMCFGDPWEGAVQPEQVMHVARRLIESGCTSLSLGDTIGTGTPGHVLALLDSLGSNGVGVDVLALHFHDTYGQALANVYAALGAGVRQFDSSAGGLGGCPYAKSATGNLATEDLVWMLNGLGVETGVDLGSLVETSLWMAERLHRLSPSRVVNALAGSRYET